MQTQIVAALSHHVESAWVGKGSCLGFQKYAMSFFVLLTYLAGASISATSYGRMAHANIISAGDKPAICLPVEEKKPLPVGWVSLSESYVKNPGGWGIALKPGAKSLELKPGDCIVFGAVPDGYERDDYKIKTPPLVLEVNRTYVFSLSDAYLPRDTYSAVFCISKAADGTLQYHQYTRLPDGRSVVPSCDAKLNGSLPVIPVEMEICRENNCQLIND